LAFVAYVAGAPAIGADVGPPLPPRSGGVPAIPRTAPYQSGSAVLAFFPRVLVQLVGFDHSVAQRVAVQPESRVLLEAVPQLQEVLAVATQLAGHLGRGPARRNAVEDQHQLRGATVRPLQDGPGPGVEDATAVTALVVQNRLPVAVVDPEALPLATCRTSQTVGME